MQLIPPSGYSLFSVRNMASMAHLELLLLHYERNFIAINLIYLRNMSLMDTKILEAVS